MNVYVYMCTCVHVYVHNTTSPPHRFTGAVDIRPAAQLTRDGYVLTAVQLAAVASTLEAALVLNTTILQAHNDDNTCVLTTTILQTRDDENTQHRDDTHGDDKTQTSHDAHTHDANTHDIDTHDDNNTQHDSTGAAHASGALRYPHTGSNARKTLRYPTLAAAALSKQATVQLQALVDVIRHCIQVWVLHVYSWCILVVNMRTHTVTYIHTQKNKHAPQCIQYYHQPPPTPCVLTGGRWWCPRPSLPYPGAPSPAAAHHQSPTHSPGR